MGDLLSVIVSIAFHGLALAMVLYLISVGLSVTMGLMGFVNLAHGVFAMAGGYVLTSLMSRFGMPFVPALLGAAVAVALASIPIERPQSTGIGRRGSVSTGVTTSARSTNSRPGERPESSHERDA